jgi:hypothetical protein
LRSSTRVWPWGRTPHSDVGLKELDFDNDGRILQMRIKDPHGAWVCHPQDSRVMIPIDHRDSRAEQGTNKEIQRYRILKEGLIDNYDGFTISNPPHSQMLDLNRNFPAGWGKNVKGSGDYPLSEPEIHSLVQAIGARPNICGANAYHTAGGVLLRPSSTKADSDLPPNDVWVYNAIGEKGTELTSSPVYSCYEDFTWDKNDACMSGAADDFMYEHLGVFSWTTEFWDIVYEVCFYSTIFIRIIKFVLHNILLIGNGEKSIYKNLVPWPNCGR